MPIINEINCPVLRYLKWSQSLDKHPEFQRFIRESKRKNVQMPFLNMNYIDKTQYVCENVINNWDKYAPRFRSDIWTASVSYGRAFEEATDSICKHRLELYKQMMGQTFEGTYIQVTRDIPMSLMYIVHLKNVKDEIRNGVQGVTMYWKGTILLLLGRDLVAAAECDDEGNVISGAIPTLKKSFLDANGSVDAGLLFMVFDNHVFRKFADVTVREVNSPAPSKSRRGQPDEDVLIVKSTLARDIHRYSINWYTETVRTAGFARKGYIGLRWKGPRGNQHPEFVPIKATWVRGYTRRAKKPDVGKTLKDFGEDDR